MALLFNTRQLAGRHVPATASGAASMHAATFSAAELVHVLVLM
jgi:hypothetical protein